MVAKLEAFRMPTLTAIALVTGRSTLQLIVAGYVSSSRLNCSILEYLSREDAERAAKELDGKELRGQPVRVTLDESVSLEPLCT